VKHRFLIALLLLGTAAFTQQQAIECPADRPVDDLITEIHKSQSKKTNRNKNPLPTNGCIFGWCVGSAKTPPTFPQPTTNPETRSPADTSSPSNGSTPTPSTGSTSKTDFERCREALDRALQAAHNVEVGDLQMEEKHYSAALSRYQEAAEEKPNDAAIEVRVGRAFEQTKDPSQAAEHYAVAAKLGTPEKWAKEAQAALGRLKAKQ
jgi:tetratricopeptide (TPR) repeat protein